MGDVGKTIPKIYIVLDNRQVDHKESIIEIDGKIFDQFFLF